METFPSLRFVQLEVPYDHWQDPMVRDLFCKTIELKIEGYKSTYPYGILPFDATDFVATHLLICETTDHGLFPLVCYKSITLKRCILHNLTFPCLNILQASHATEHFNAIQLLLKSYENRPSEISYDSGFTIHPKARSDKALSKELKNMLMGYVALYTREKKIRTLIGMGMTKVKADQYFISWGYRPFQSSKGELPTLLVKSHFLQESRLIENSGFSLLARTNAKKYVNLWKDRLLIQENEISKAPAA